MKSEKKIVILIAAMLVISAFALVTPASAALWQWEQVSEEGFGDLTNDYAWAMVTYTPLNDTTEYLYVGTLNTDLSGSKGEKGCEVWRTNGTMAGGKYVWEQVVGPNGSQAKAGFTSIPLSFASGTRNMVVYNDLLWTGTGPLAEVFVTNGATWKRANLPGFGPEDNETLIKGMTVYKGKLYVEAEDRVNGGNVFRYDGPTDFDTITPSATWTEVSYNGFDNTNYTRGSLLIPFNPPDDGGEIEYLYACGRSSGSEGDFFDTISNPNGLEIWRTDGTKNPDGTFVWERVVGRGSPYGNPLGWGNDANSVSLSVFEFQNKLYVGTADFQGLTAELWRTTDGVNWTCVEPNGFGRTNIYMWRMIGYQGKLIVGTMNAFFGCELWASDTGDPGTFEQINLRGMDLSYNLPANLGAFFGTDFIVPLADQYGARSVAEFQGYLMVGTASWGDWVDKMLYKATNGSWENVSNYVGCEIWRTNGNTYSLLNIRVNKTVWDPVNRTWVDELDTRIGDTVRFRYELNNTERYNLTNITVFDFLSSSLEYSNSSATPQEPSLVVPLTMGDSTLGTILVWDLSNVELEPGQKISVEYNASVMLCGAGINFLSATGQFKDMQPSFGLDSAMVLVPCPSGDATDPEAGTIDEFYNDEEVYATGSGFAPDTYVDIYILDDYPWFNGKNITCLTIYANLTVKTDEYGNITPVEIWPNPDPGEYDIFFDADQNRIYNDRLDVVDHPNQPGFTVIGRPPTVTGTPTDGAMGVAITTTISATFSEAMNTTSVEDAFNVSPGVSGKITWEGNKMIFTPDSELKYGTKYTVMISTKAEDELGTPLAGDYNWSFTTKSALLRGGRGAPRDSDDDGYSDVKEILAGTNPNDPDDYPGKPAATPTPTATATPTPEEPGFEAVFAIAGLLAVAYLVLRLKK